ncbi:MAG: outer membrane beta-barrel protein [Salinimicrobium sediminis]|uniref:Outer membrane protein beta-barrel domain-containing protein n=1 Tax=Salinimicrobium sediminis TaxID=1343891 RepID=A0A285WZM3_9FLAO|nr:outer membrane beta-barrel protein [Salinimicrobium sediminis]MDX1602993.1 outer membrane beta-barrel protein [Salinimicrobium sediminis]SOC78508.1 Outer membrane protein beta-barrel domain-containing protein [Salinimicrobium sediminis]
MKKYVVLLMFCITSAAMAQSGFGVKGGLNYADNGEMTYTDFTNAGEDIIEGGESKMGYHFGVFYQMNILGFSLRPELVYTTTKSSYQFNQEEADYNVSKIDLPILVGTKVFGPVKLFAGPSLQYIVDNDFEGFELGDVKDEFTIGAQLGAGIQLGKIGLDVRYERALKENEAEFMTLDGSNSGPTRVDTRPSQVIFSLSLDL